MVKSSIHPMVGSCPSTAACGKAGNRGRAHAVNIVTVCLDLDPSHSFVGSEHLDPV